jgi:ubiquinone/menaquinone biosynthesis C-methylase UbiE
VPFKNKEFDTAIILYVLHHVKNWKFVINELKRVSKKVVIFEVIYRYKILKSIFFIPFLIINKFTLVNFFLQEEFEGSISHSIPKTEKDPKAKFIDNVAQILNLFFAQKIFIINCVK